VTRGQDPFGGSVKPRLSVEESRAIREGLRSAWPVALLAVAVGVVADVPALIPVGILLGVLAMARTLFLRRGLRGFEYQRTLPTRHAVWGDRVPVTVRVWNRSWLPAAWLTAEDQLSEAVIIRGARASDAAPAGGRPPTVGSAPAEGRPATPGSVTPRERSVVGEEITGRRWLRNAWTLWPYERVERRFVLEADHRGRIAFGPVRLAAADLFAGTAGEGDLQLPYELTVAPRSLPVRTGSSRARWSAQQRAVPGFPEDPAHFVGVRAYQPGDSPRRIHWRATARTGTPRSKRFEASRERELLLAIDIQTVDGPAVGAGYDAELVETLCVTAASLARDAIGGGARCGLAAAAYSYRPRAEVRVAPAAGPRQLLTLTDTLARLSPYASGPFGTLLAGLPRWLPLQAQIVILTARDPSDWLPVTRRLRASGFDLQLIAVGPERAAIATRARDAALPTLVADLGPDWRIADALALAS
jgi:uncharacterized protein (DUF58 family)